MRTKKRIKEKPDRIGYRLGRSNRGGLFEKGDGAKALIKTGAR
jgi:hypothetical protein